MPWVFFLPTLVVLRMVRFSVSTVSILLGWSPVEPSDFVLWLQNHRRSLRALRFQGLNDIRVGKKDANMKPLNMLSTMFFTLRGICRRNRPYVEPEPVVIGLQSVSIPTGQYCPHKNKSKMFSQQKQDRNSTGKRRRSVDADADVDDSDENVHDALNRTYTENENEKDITFELELDAVSTDSQLSSEYESVSDSGCSEPVR